ncbi:MAG: hypothetical protein D6785_09965 [Planctomycetota bacterium]|nr:MAG: hypothetical protein D6785_09965 [Planctomycetota bacterium]
MGKKEELLSQSLQESRLADMLQDHHKKLLVLKILEYDSMGPPPPFPPPHLPGETTPSLHHLFKPFQEVLSFFENSLKTSLEKESFQDLVPSLKDCWNTLDMASILLLMGQRLTPASLQTQEALPPSPKRLLQSCMEPYNSQISVVGRAWEKHIGRRDDGFWGVLQGSSREKEEHALQIVQTILEEGTWWNIFIHLSGKAVFEKRLASGYGARWTHNGDSFIGFLDPLEIEENPL